MIRIAFAISLSLAVALGPMEAQAATDKNSGMFGLTPMELGIGVATAITLLRIVAVFTVGAGFFGRNLGAGLLTIYLGHVVVEGVVYGAGAGAASYAVGAASAKIDESEPPRILPQRQKAPPTSAPHLPLGMAHQPDQP